MKQNSGMSLVEVMIVLGIFSMMVLVINGVIISAQNLWSSSNIFSTLEDEALRVSRQIAGDLEKSSVMKCPTGSGLAYTDLLPHIDETGGTSLDGYYGDNITFLVPSFGINGQPQLKITNSSLGVDWLSGTVISFSLVTVGGKKVIRRTSYSVGDFVNAETTDLTNNAISLSFRDKDTDSALPYFVIKWAFVLQRKGVAARTYTVNRNGEVFLRNSRGAEDLY